jgi:hypothetical protein
MNFSGDEDMTEKQKPQPIRERPGVCEPDRAKMSLPDPAITGQKKEDPPANDHEDPESSRALRVVRPLAGVSPY